MAKRTPEAPTEPEATPTETPDPAAEYQRLIAEIAAQSKLVPLNEVKSISNGNGPETQAGEILYKLRIAKREAFSKLS